MITSSVMQKGHLARDGYDKLTLSRNLVRGQKKVEAIKACMCKDHRETTDCVYKTVSMVMVQRWKKRATTTYSKAERNQRVPVSDFDDKTIY